MSGCLCLGTRCGPLLTRQHRSSLGVPNDDLRMANFVPQYMCGQLRTSCPTHAETPQVYPSQVVADASGGSTVCSTSRSIETLDCSSKKRKREVVEPAPRWEFGKVLKRSAQNEPSNGKEVRAFCTVVCFCFISTSKIPIVFTNREDLVNELRTSFQKTQHVDFAGCYKSNDSGRDHKQCIQTITHEIWKATGYRFTYVRDSSIGSAKLTVLCRVKDHPKIKDGHKTRLWCSQDDAHKHRAKARQLQDNQFQLNGSVELPSKARYPCRSRLLISSRNTDEGDMRLITVRMHHHSAHGPYIDPAMPQEVTKAVWERMGWSPNPNTWSNSSASLPSDQRMGVAEGSAVGSNSPLGRLSREPAPRRISNASHVPTPSPHSLPPKYFQDRMHGHIRNIRDFCDGLEYQLQFDDHRILDLLETEGSSFLRLVEDCLRKEGRLADLAAQATLSSPYASDQNPTSYLAQVVRMTPANRNASENGVRPRANPPTSPLSSDAS